MLIDGVVVVHVELHQAHHAAEFRHEAAEDAGFVHQPERAFRIVARRQDLEEQPVRLRVAANVVADRIERARDGS
jgi:hypothetical protein